MFRNRCTIQPLVFSFSGIEKSQHCIKPKKLYKIQTEKNIQFIILLNQVISIDVLFIFEEFVIKRFIYYLR
jgi:hypothetical protein